MAWSTTRARDRRSAAGPPAVTKALTAIAPDHPELEAARTRGIPLEPWQQVIADAAAGRRRRRRRDARQEHNRGLACPRARRGRAGSLGVRRSAAALRAGAAVNGPARPSGRPVRGGGRRVRGQLRPVPAVARRPDLGRVGPPGRVPDEAAVLARSSWPRRMRPAPDGIPPAVAANVGDAGVEHRGRAGGLAGRDRRDRGRRCRGPADRRVHPRASPERFTTPAGPAASCSVGSSRPSRRAQSIEDLRPRRPARPAAGPSSDHRAHNVANALASPRLPPGWGWTPTASWPDWPRSRASAGASSGRAKSAASPSTTTTATTRPRSGRRSRPSASASPDGASGPSTNR